MAGVSVQPGGLVKRKSSALMPVGPGGDNASYVLLWKWKLTTGPHQQKHNQLVEGGDYFPLYGSDEATSGKRTTNKMLQNWGEPSSEPQEGAGHGHREGLQEIGLLSVETRRPKGVLTAVSPTSWGSRKDTVKEREAMGMTSNMGILSTYQERMLLFGEGVQCWNRCPGRQRKVVPPVSRNLE